MTPTTESRSRTLCKARKITLCAGSLSLIFIFVVGALNEAEPAVALSSPGEPHVVVRTTIVAVADFPHNIDAPTFILELPNVSRAIVVGWPKIDFPPNIYDLRLAAFNDGPFIKKNAWAFFERRTSRKLPSTKINSIESADDLGIATSDIHNRESTVTVGIVTQENDGIYWRNVGAKEDVADNKPWSLRRDKLSLNEFELSSASEKQSSGSGSQAHGSDCKNGSEKHQPLVVVGDGLFSGLMPFFYGLGIGLVLMLGSVALVYWDTNRI